MFAVLDCGMQFRAISNVKSSQTEGQFRAGDPMNIPLFLQAFLLSIVAVLATSFLHYESVHRLDLLARRPGSRRHYVMLTIICGIIAIHLADIFFYSLVYRFAIGTLGLGTISSATISSPMEMFYFAAETYSSLGQGDLLPTGAIRIISSISSLNGLLLLAWSGSFLYALAHRPLPSDDFI